MVFGVFAFCVRTWRPLWRRVQHETIETGSWRKICVKLRVQNPRARWRHRTTVSKPGGATASVVLSKRRSSAFAGDVTILGSVKLQVTKERTENGPYQFEHFLPNENLFECSGCLVFELVAMSTGSVRFGVVMFWGVVRFVMFSCVRFVVLSCSILKWVRIGRSRTVHGKVLSTLKILGHMFLLHIRSTTNWNTFETSINLQISWQKYEANKRWLHQAHSPL